MNLEVVAASVEDKPLVQRMMELYQYDFSTLENSDLDAHGYFGYSYLDHYWVEPGRHPFIVRVNGKLAGFVLVNQFAVLPGNEWSVGEFFILRRYRRQGIGRQVARYIFEKFRGKWEVREIEANQEARHFWEAVIGEYTGGQYEEAITNDERWQGPIQYFDNTTKFYRE